MPAMVIGPAASLLGLVDILVLGKGRVHFRSSHSHEIHLTDQYIRLTGWILALFHVHDILISKYGLGWFICQSRVLE